VDYLVAAWQYVQGNWGEFSAAVTRHVQYCVLALVIAMVICIPLGILAARSRVVSLATLNVFGAARAVPSIAILFLMIPIPGLGFSFTSVLIALTILACPPILVNTAAGFQNVDTAVVEAARGMGMGGWQVLRRIELPLALPVVLAGIRTATLEVIASATLATFLTGGGLGDLITQGLGNIGNTQQVGVLLAGAITVALLALGAEVIFGALQRAISPSV
jgi:osmoprotectant transport system permease protein